MRLGESRQGEGMLVVAAHQLVRDWVWLYTLGLSRETRSARRAEIDADVWDQTHAWALPGASTSDDASSVLLRSLRGMPADLLWRFAEARTNRSSTEGRPTMETFTMRSSLERATLALMALLVVATIGVVVVHQIDRNSSTQIISRDLLDVLYNSVLPVGLVLTVTGLGLIRRAPWLGAVLAVGGIWTPALMFFWQIWPLFIAAVVSVLAIRWARRRISAG